VAFNASSLTPEMEHVDPARLRPPPARACQRRVRRPHASQRSRPPPPCHCLLLRLAPSLRLGCMRMPCHETGCNSDAPLTEKTTRRDIRRAVLPPLLAVRDVTMRFGGIVALDRVSFDI